MHVSGARCRRPARLRNAKTGGFTQQLPGFWCDGGGGGAAADWRRRPELPITCCNGLINVKVCITSESWAVGQAIDGC